VLGAIALLALPVIFALVGRDERTDPVTKTTIREAQPALAGNIKPEVADASDPTTAGVLLDRYDPETLVLVAGARPLMRPLQQQTWETFSVNWHTDVRPGTG
jgi:hypothetical protein